MLKKYFFTRLELLSLAVWRSLTYRHLLFTLATLVSVSLMGYHFGTFDQAIHIPFLKKFADPSLYPNDYFFNLRFYHYSFFWFLFLPFYHLGILEITLFCAYLLTIYLTFWALWKLSRTLFNNPMTSLVTVFVFVFPHIGFSGFPIIEFSLLNRTFVLPFLLFAIDLYLNKRYSSAFFLLGLMYNLHVISVNFILFMFIFSSLFNLQKIKIKNFLLGIFFFVIGALPVLLWKLRASPIEFGVNYDWFWIVSQGMLYHLFYFYGSNLYSIIFSLSGIASVALFFIARKHMSFIKHSTIITSFVIGLIIILVIQLLATYIYPSTIIIQSQIMRVGLFLLIFSLLFFTHFIIISYQAKKIDAFHSFLLLMTLIVSVTPLIVLGIYSIRRLIAAKFLAISILFIVFLTFVSIVVVTYNLNVWRPGVSIFPKKTSFYKVQMWARINTGKKTIFIAPPDKWWFFDVEWRVGSERSEVVALSDLLEISFVPDYIPIWKERFENVAPGVIKQFKGDVFSNFINTYKAYYSNSSDQFKRIAKIYNASYLIVEKPHLYDFPKVFENEGYIVYDLRNNNMR